jgi:hypothetical protein
MTAKLLTTLLTILLALATPALTSELSFIPTCSDRNYVKEIVKNPLIMWFEIYRIFFCVSTNNSDRDISTVTTLSSADAATAATTIFDSISAEQSALDAPPATSPFIHYTPLAGQKKILKLPQNSGAGFATKKIAWRSSEPLKTSGQIYTFLSDWCKPTTFADPSHWVGATFNSTPETLTGSPITPLITYYNYATNNVYTSSTTTAPAAISLAGTVCGNQMVSTEFEITYGTANEISAVKINVSWITSVDYGSTGAVLGAWRYSIVNIDAGTTEVAFYANGTPGYKIGDFTIVGERQETAGVFNGV